MGSGIDPWGDGVEPSDGIIKVFIWCLGVRARTHLFPQRVVTVTLNPAGEISVCIQYPNHGIATNRLGNFGGILARC